MSLQQVHIYVHGKFSTENKDNAGMHGTVQQYLKYLL